MQTYQRQIITVGYDDRGNAIQYIDNEDGTWTDFYEERLESDTFVRQNYHEFLQDV